PFLDRPHLPARDRHPAGTADGGGADDPGGSAATRVQATDHASASFDYKSGYDRRAFLQVPLADPNGSARPMDDRAAPDGCTGRGKRRDMGPAGSSDPGAGGPGTAARSKGLGVFGPRDHG